MYSDDLMNYLFKYQNDEFKAQEEKTDAEAKKAFDFKFKPVKHAPIPVNNEQ